MLDLYVWLYPLNQPTIFLPIEWQAAQGLNNVAPSCANTE
jgi:hypothetical protein